MLKDGSRVAEFGERCAECPLRAKCTQAKSGRTIKLHPKHETLDRHRKRQRDDAWNKQYRKVRPRVERKIGHLIQSGVPPALPGRQPPFDISRG